MRNYMTGDVGEIVIPNNRCPTLRLNLHDNRLDFITNHTPSLQYDNSRRIIAMSYMRYLASPPSPEHHPSMPHITRS